MTAPHEYVSRERVTAAFADINRLIDQPQQHADHAHSERLSVDLGQA